MKHAITAEQRDELFPALRALMAQYRVAPHTLHKLAELAMKEGK